MDAEPQGASGRGEGKKMERRQMKVRRNEDEKEGNAACKVMLEVVLTGLQTHFYHSSTGQHSGRCANANLYMCCLFF